MYICRFLQNWNLGIRTFARNANINETVIRNIVNGQTKHVHLNSYFKMADYMSKQSKIPVEHYLRRMKEEFELGDLKNEE